jgi:hypothetical protein
MSYSFAASPAPVVDRSAVGGHDQRRFGQSRPGAGGVAAGLLERRRHPPRAPLGASDRGSRRVRAEPERHPADRELVDLRRGLLFDRRHPDRNRLGAHVRPAERRHRDARRELGEHFPERARCRGRQEPAGQPDHGEPQRARARRPERRRLRRAGDQLHRRRPAGGFGDRRDRLPAGALLRRPVLGQLHQSRRQSARLHDRRPRPGRQGRARPDRPSDLPDLPARAPDGPGQPQPRPRAGDEHAFQSFRCQLGVDAPGRTVRRRRPGRRARRHLWRRNQSRTHSWPRSTTT